MRLSKLKQIFSPEVLLWLMPAALVVPNVILDITDYSNWLVKIANVVAPFSIYLWLTSLSPKVGRTVFFMLPFLFYAGFQIVLLYLYGESIIAVDMFLNLVTTNVAEATELLGNLLVALATVLLLYLVPLVWGIISAFMRQEAGPVAVSYARRISKLLLMASVGFIVAAYIFIPRFNVFRHIFPFNVMNNTVTAISRTIDTSRYYATSADFDFDAICEHPDSLREVYVLVIGETSRADNWQLGGYERATNPLLSRRSDIVFFDKALSQSNTTHKSVPLLLAPVTTETFGDSIYEVKSVITAFNQVGYGTAFFSNQARNRSFIDYFASEAQTVRFLRDDGHAHYDQELIDMMNNYISNTSANKLFIVLHTYGSHFKYLDRYTGEYRAFTPDNSNEAIKSNRDQLINAYDNTIVYTDAMLDGIANMLDRLDCPAAMLYLSDHGEDIYDDPRNRFLHSSPVPTYHQIHVPLLLWISHEYNYAYPETLSIARAHQHSNIASNDIVFHTLLDIADILTPYCDSSRSIINSAYEDRPRTYLNDYNESVPLDFSGLRGYDFVLLKEKNILSK
ncbi:MAG: phosphoethanolamine transferase [Muribaculaceae bacterium]